MVCAQFISISHARITSGDNYRERGLVNRIASRAQYFLACHGRRFESFRRAMNAYVEVKCLRASASPAATPRFLHMRIAIGPIVFFTANHSFLSRALLFFRPLSFISQRTRTRPSDNQFSVTRESAIGRRTVRS